MGAGGLQQNDVVVDDDLVASDNLKFYSGIGLSARIGPVSAYIGLRRVHFSSPHGKSRDVHR